VWLVRRYDGRGINCVRDGSRFTVETTRFARVVFYLERERRLVG